MQQKHIDFITTMQQIAKVDPSARPVLECVTKSYIINEGLFRNLWDKTKATVSDLAGLAHKTAVPAYNRLKEIAHTDTPKLPQPEIKQKQLSQQDEQLIKEDKQTFASDFADFLSACKVLMNHLSSYGDAAFIKEAMTPEFAAAYNSGLYIDTLRRNPLSESISRAMVMKAVLESIRTQENSDIIDAISNTYALTEATHDLDVMCLLESADDDDLDDEEMEKINQADAKRRKQESELTLHNTIMPIIAKFIRKHGAFPWRKALRSPKFTKAREIGEKIRKGELQPATV